MTDIVIRKSVYIQASPTEVWAFLTEPDKLAKWFHAPKEELTEGAELAMYGSESGNLLIWGKVTAARKPEYLEYSFTIKQMGDATSRVAWTLDAVAGGTRLSLEHSGLPQSVDAFGLTLSLDKGWDEHIGRMRAHMHGDS